jgi:hypothetical protein
VIQQIMPTADRHGVPAAISGELLDKTIWRRHRRVRAQGAANPLT